MVVLVLWPGFTSGYGQAVESFPRFQVKVALPDRIDDSKVKRVPADARIVCRARRANLLPLARLLDTAPFQWLPRWDELLQRNSLRFIRNGAAIKTGPYRGDYPQNTYAASKWCRR